MGMLINVKIATREMLEKIDLLKLITIERTIELEVLE
jgi:hypothetical protein